MSFSDDDDIDARTTALTQPLSIIDMNCDFEEVLKVGRINVVKALRQLCPNIPGMKILFFSRFSFSEFKVYAGMPTKKRKEHECRAQLTADERKRLEQDINRVNAKLSRKRQKM